MGWNSFAVLIWWQLPSTASEAAVHPQNVHIPRCTWQDQTWNQLCRHPESCIYQLVGEWSLWAVVSRSDWCILEGWLRSGLCYQGANKTTWLLLLPVSGCNNGWSSCHTIIYRLNYLSEWSLQEVISRYDWCNLQGWLNSGPCYQGANWLPDAFCCQ